MFFSSLLIDGVSRDAVFPPLFYAGCVCVTDAAALQQSVGWPPHRPHLYSDKQPDLSAQVHAGYPYLGSLLGSVLAAGDLLAVFAVDQVKYSCGLRRGCQLSLPAAHMHEIRILPSRRYNYWLHETFAEKVAWLCISQCRAANCLTLRCFQVQSLAGPQDFLQPLGPGHLQLYYKDRQFDFNDSRV